MPTLISDLFVPQIWIPSIREKAATFPSVLNSGVAVRSPLFDAIATGAGIAANVPFFRDITDQNDGIQVEDTAPAADQKITTGLQAAPILNRETKNSATALAAAVSGVKPVEDITAQLGLRRLKQRNKTLIALLRGAFNGLGAAAAAAPLLANRVDSFDESGVGASANQIMNADLFIQAKALLGELDDQLINGAFIVHPNVYAALEKADAASFKNGVQSGLPFSITTYRQVPIFKSSLLSRAGTTDGSVYDSYILAPGIVAYGEKTQLGDVIDVASLQYNADKDKNNEAIYDRTRFLMHLNGMRWVGSPAGQSATNVELQTAPNWNLVYTSADRVGAVCIRTNG